MATTIPSFARVNLYASATLSSGAHPTGSITFTLVYGGRTVDTETVSVNGDGIYTTPVGYAAGSTTVGTYQWNVSYSGDTANQPVSDTGNVAARAVVATLSLSYTGGDDRGDLTDGVPTIATATLSGGYNPTGSLVFTFYHPGDTTNAPCSFTVNVDAGAGSYSTPRSCTATISYSSHAQWKVTYSGDANNANQTVLRDMFVKF